MTGIETIPSRELIVLLVEDLQDDVFFFKLAIKRAQLSPRLQVAMDGTEAVDYFTNRGRFADAALHPKPDLVFLDLKMPNMNGFEVLEWLAANPVIPLSKVVVLTGSEEPGDRMRAREFGTLAYLIKPPQREKLVELFASALAPSPANTATVTL